jgi:cullin-associated NEDD8-dissociated protein 1
VLVTRAQEVNVIDIAQNLCSHILNGSKEMRDIYSIGLKTLITDVPAATGDRVTALVTKSLLKGIAGTSGVVAECLDILTEMLRRFGGSMDRDHVELMRQCLALVCVGLAAASGGLRFQCDLSLS